MTYKQTEKRRYMIECRRLLLRLDLTLVTNILKELKLQIWIAVLLIWWRQSLHLSRKRTKLRLLQQSRNTCLSRSYLAVHLLLMKYFLLPCSAGSHQSKAHHRAVLVSVRFSEIYDPKTKVLFIYFVTYRFSIDPTIKR
uniref:Ovule protein n=1 Tax=Heterorhabditis bacteriophora TaxID=37862 RepID=A0A1I7X8A4_HETBA